MKSFLISLIVIVIAALWGYYYFFKSGYTLPKLSANNITPTINLSVSVFPSITPTPSIPPVPTISDNDQIKQAFADKYQKKISDINLKVSQNLGGLAQGTVSFKGENGGGWLLAAKKNGSWLVVQDGNGYVSCEAIAPYNFPQSMIPICVNKNGKLIKL